MFVSMKSGMRDKYHQSCIILNVGAYVCGSGHPGEPGVVPVALLEFEVDDSELGGEISDSLLFFPIFIIVSFSTSVIVSLSQGSEANSSGSLCCCGGVMISVGGEDEMVLPQGRATLVNTCVFSE